MAELLQKTALILFSSNAKIKYSRVPNKRGGGENNRGGVGNGSI